MARTFEEKKEIYERVEAILNADRSKSVGQACREVGLETTHIYYDARQAVKHPPQQLTLPEGTVVTSDGRRFFTEDAKRQIVARINARVESGESNIQDACAAEGVVDSLYRQWKKKLESGATLKQQAGRPRGSKSQPKPVQPKYQKPVDLNTVPVQPTNNPAAPPPEATAPPSQLMVMIGSPDDVAKAMAKLWH